MYYIKNRNNIHAIPFRVLIRVILCERTNLLVKIGDYVRHMRPKQNSVVLHSIIILVRYAHRVR